MAKLFRFICVIIWMIVLFQSNLAIGQTPNFENDVFFPPNTALAAPSAICNNSSTDFVNKYGRYGYYTPDADMPIKTIMINLNIFQKDDGTGNWSNNATDLANLSQIIAWLNAAYANNQTPTDPITGVAFISDTKIRFEVAGIYFYQSTALEGSSDQYALLNRINSVDPNRMKQLNICLTNGTYGSASAFAALPSSNFNYDQYVVAFKTWNNGNTGGYYACSTTLAHELGHCLDLLHTYGTSYTETCTQSDLDYMDDIFGTGASAICPHSMGWSCDPSASGNTCTNNILGGTQFAGYFSPKQMAKIHRALSLKSVRRYVKDCTYSAAPKSITANETWDFNMKFYSDIIIEPGVTLTMKCNLLMPDAGKIIVKRGAKLVLDGGTITTGCAGMWAGVELWGDRSQRQLATLQGTVQIINGGVIENARDGITTCRRDAGGNIYWDYTGGIVQCTGAVFRNNRRGVEFLSYQNKSTIGTTVNNVSFFRNCIFETTSLLKDINTPPYAFVSMYDLRGISFSGCTFQNTAPNLFNADERGIGIGSYESSYNVTATYSGGILQYPNEPTVLNRGQFINLYQGINATTPTGAINKNCQIRDNTFDNVLQGITGNMNFSTIKNNIFNVPASIGLIPTWGIYLDGAKGFNIYQNTLTGASMTGNYGIIARNSDVYGGEIRSNTFGNLDFGTQTELNNDRLIISCNSYSGNHYAWSINPISVNGKLASQGTNCLATGIRAGNSFISCTSADNKLSSYLTTSFNYFAWNSPSTLVPCVDPGANKVNLSVCSSGGGSSTNDPTYCAYNNCSNSVCATALRTQWAVETDAVTKQQMMNQLIRYYLYNDDENSAIQILIDANTTDAKKLLIPTYIARGETDKAQALLPQIPGGDSENANYIAYFNIMINRTSPSFTFSASQNAIIHDIAVSATTTATNAQVALQISQGETIIRIPEDIPNNLRIQSPSEKNVNAPLTNDKSILSDNYPNPVDNSTSINAYVESENSAELCIFTLFGEKVKSYKLNKGDNTVVIAKKDLSHGVYFYSLKIADKIMATKKMIVLQ
jgi:hypothetical protein